MIYFFLIRMTDTEQNLLQKKSDLKLYYEMAHEAAQANNVDEARKISLNGLKIAQSQDQLDWVEKFDSFNSQLPQKVSNTSLTPSIVKEDLTVVKGIGPSVAERLINAGIRSINMLAKTTAKKLALIPGIGLSMAQKMIDKAKDHLCTQSLTRYSHLNEDSKKETKVKIRPKKNLSDYKLTLIPSTPIVIDGSNVAWMGGDKKKGDIPKIKYLLDLKKELERIGLENITIFCDYGLPKIIDNPAKLIDLIENKIIHQAPNEKEVDDHYVLQYAKKVDGYIIVETEKFRNWYDKKGYRKEWIRERRISVRYVNGVFMFSPEIEVVENENYEELEEKEHFEDATEEDVAIDAIKSNFVSPVEPWFEEKFNYSRLTEDLNTAKMEFTKNEELKEYEEPLIVEQNEVKSEDFDDLDEDYEEESNYNLHIINPNEYIHETPRIQSRKNEENRGTLTYDEIDMIKEKIRKQLKSCEFLNVDRNSDLRAIFTGIDLLTLKRIRVNEFLDLLYIIPIKVSNLKGKFIVSAGKIKYTPNKESEGNFNLNKIPLSFVKALQNAETTIFNDMSRKGALFQYIVKHFQFDISIEKTLTHKSLFFRSGPIQYKLLIEPLIISPNSVGFTEKLIPFAYQKTSNIHIVEMAQFRDFLHFLDQKYFLIETYQEKRSAVSINCEVEERFMKDLRKFSSPFIFYGFTLLIIFLFQEFQLLTILINIGYGVVGLYIIVIGYIYLRFFTEKRQIKQEFATPYYQKKVKLDDTGLALIREELTPKLMEQFAYEVMGDNNHSSVIAEIEQTNARDFLESKKMKNLVDRTDFFEEEGGSPRRSENSKVKRTLIEKYSSFLED